MKKSIKQCHPTQADVVIAGLGPTGLVLAHVLGKRGHHVVVLEREPVFYGNARAVYTDDECMRIFQSIDMAEDVQKDMLLETPVQLAYPDGRVIAQYKPLKRPFGWPIVNFFYQPYLETTLTEGLARYENVSILRGREVVNFEQDADGVDIQHQATQSYRFSDANDAKVAVNAELAEQDLQSIRAQYFVGADGGRSTVRANLGIEMTGKNFPEPWLVVDLKQKDPHQGLRHLPYFNFVVDPELPVVSCVQPDGFHRFEFMLKKGQSKEYMEQDDTVRMLLSKYVDPDLFEVKRKLVYTFNALVANQWRDRRVLLAGDAAHMTPQFMGQGASSGVRDGANLGWKLSAVLEGKASEKILDSYESERRDHAIAMIRGSVLMKDMVSMTSPVGSKVRDLAIKGILSTPKLKDWAQEGGFKPQPIYTRGQYLGLPRKNKSSPEGSLSPQPFVRTIAGKRILLDQLTGENYALVGLSCDPSAHLSESSRQVLNQLGCAFVTLYPFAERPQGDTQTNFNPQVIEVEDIDGHMVHWFRKACHVKHPVALLRPDKFSFAVVPQDELDGAIQQLKLQLDLVNAKSTMQKSTEQSNVQKSTLNKTQTKSVEVTQELSHESERATASE
ncbi:3-(3-hydroxy-phenyl)propionate hydroxylase [Acinetobacter marinus]|uniref:3-(3-hydroxy-phenyl)propionate hydroxylase n=1 Tax=Acinetobacter marinus TaxID=281375 RepID=A0A1G6GJH7_9GAMM|nr:bifunctional 3-(3-hydroxy-phenyl)propionate/3-hydroxycinnamic acid hydroxylase [Acinetobacter marinus]SDB82148.1 3-(3-hydroxy-phenyl)propionate hydroxylase [Acinetobacter marinus]